MKVPLSSALLSLALTGGLLLCGCQPEPSPAKQQAPAPPMTKVDHIKVDDGARRAMESAIQQARQQIDVFVHAVESPTSGQTYFSVKKRFTYTKDGHTTTEDIWLSKVVYADGIFVGYVANEPVYVKDVKVGDKASVAKAEATDWMIIENKRLIGGYTIRVLRELMPEKERAEFDQSVPFKFE